MTGIVACSRPFFRNTSSHHISTSIGVSLGLYTVMLLGFVPKVSSLTFNPVSMSDPNKAKEYGIGTAALVCATVSLLASILCMYWFCRMEKRFRHRLILILLYGDLMRGTWLFVFAIISLARGTVKSQSTFCQVSGFLVQYGTQTSDYAVLVMAIHSAIQVFYPSTLVSSDGLYPCRRYVYIGAFVLPVLMAGLGFVKSTHAYVSQGAFCSLPIRPFWYRLALIWVPRYIIVLLIIGLAIAIYTHVGFEVRSYSNADASFQSFKTTDGTNTPQENVQNDTKMEDITFELTSMEPRPQPQRRKSSIGHELFTSQRRTSSMSALSPVILRSSQRVSFDGDKISCSVPETAQDPIRARLDTTRPILVAIPSGQSVAASISLPAGIPWTNAKANEANNPEPIVNTPSSTSTRTPSPSSPAQLRLTKQRQRIHRQLRLMFIYPLVYTLMWLIPFAMHCMNYWNKYAANPVEFLRVGSSICIALMGFVDALIFSLREKPWRSIESSDGTFWGSFVVYRRKRPADGETQVGSWVTDTEGATRGRGSQSYRTSASGDFARIAAEQARARLDLEREERMRAVEVVVKKRGGDDEDEDEGGGEGEENGGLNVGDGKEGQVYDDIGLEDDTADTEYNRRK